MRTRAAIFFGLYLCTIVYLTLFPWDFQFYARGQGLYWFPRNTRRSLLDAALNLLLFVPLGVSGFLAFGSRWWSALTAVAAGALTSWTIEWLQLWTPGRYGNLNDVAANSLGALLGCAATFGIQRSGWWRRSEVRGHASRWRLDWAGGLFLGIWVLWNAFPFVPAIGLGQLDQLTEPTPWSWQSFGQALVGFALLTRILRGSPWLVLAYLVLPAQMFLVDRSLSYSALVGAGVGAMAARAGSHKVHGAWVWMLPLWLVFEEFRPFRIAAPRPFGWEPFRTWYETASLTSFYPVVFAKLFFYTGSVWAVRQRLGWAWALGIPAAILAVGEWSQQWLEGRTPESTDLVVLAAGAILLRMCSKE